LIDAVTHHSRFCQALYFFHPNIGRAAGNCYFVSNSESETVAKLLASRKRQWETGITPEQINNVNRLMYEFQNTFKGF
jgi:hypothetical protein